MNTNNNAICPDNQQTPGRVRNDDGTAVAALIFSKDRAMQLQATIESLLLHCRDSNAFDIVVLFKASDVLHRKEYGELKTRFPAVAFVEETCFRQQVLSLVANYRYVLFLVDDNIFVRPFSIKDAVAALNSQKNAIGFSLRLGRNTVYCYTLSSRQSLPAFESAGKGILKYYWPGAECDFGYPLELSSSVYRSSEILRLLSRLEFSNPNVLENQMCSNKDSLAASLPFLLTFEESVTFCNPVNVVQQVYENNKFGTTHVFSPQYLADCFSRGMTIDVRKYAGFTPHGAHQEVELYFTTAAACPACPELVEGRRDDALKPKFSIVMANYNNGNYINQAVESVLNQTFNDWELVIVDDCSTDNSVDIISRYLTDGRIRLLRHDINKGYTASLKTAIAAVSSDLFGVLDSDDCLTPQAVETMYHHHAGSPDCGLIYSQFAYCYENLTTRCIGFCAQIPPGQTSLDLNAVSHFKTFKLSDYLKTSGYDENILYAEDVDIIYKMEEVAGLKFVDKCLYLYRELPGSICHSSSKINVAIMSRVKARINALKRRCAALAASDNKYFEDLFARAVKQARNTHKDVDQYFIILTKLYENNLLSDSIIIPADVKAGGYERELLWLAANVNIKFDKLFELLKCPVSADKSPVRSQQPADMSLRF
ncbi:MAG: glycosyltransferase family 2 protein [Sedimentisphaerales bacterium]